MAYVARAELERADGEVAQLRAIQQHPAFASTLKDSPLPTNLTIATRSVEGELAARRGRYDEAIRRLEDAVAAEDALPYAEPPVWHHPPRQILGAILLEAGRPRDAEAVYVKDLTRFRENGWSLFGLAQSFAAQGRAADAEAVRARFARAWARADITLTSSRVLQPAADGTASGATMPEGDAKMVARPAAPVQ